MWNSAENAFARSASFREEGEEEEALRWAALERLPTYKRARRGIFKTIIGDKKEIDVSDLQAQEQRLLLERLVDFVDNDPERFFNRMRSRFDAVDLEFPKIEVRFQNLTVETFVHVGSRALPTIPNFICNMTEALLRQLWIYKKKRSKLTILSDINGIIRPSRLTLLLGPPSSGKTTLLLALAGRLGPGLQMSGNITYNGHGLNEFVPQRTSAYVSQQDWHMAEMTVRETLQFAGCCQGVGFKFDMLLELARREKNAGIKPDEDLDIFMKSLALGGQETNIVVEYIMKVWTYVVIHWWEMKCSRASQGDKRSGLQQIVYQGPRETALDFFKQMGFSCPERKNVADFLQEVTSKKDQEQYWSVLDRPYRYVPVGKFAEAFSLYREGKILSEELNIPFNRRHNHPAALATCSYGAKKLELLKTNFQWQKLLMKRNSFIYVFKFVQLLLVALITMTVFFRTTMHHNTIDDGNLYLGALYFSMVIILFNGFTEVSMLVAKLPVLYKHRDLHFYPSWAYTIPSWFLSIPISLMEAGCWVAVSYYAIGYDPAITRFFQQLLLYFFLHQMSIGLFRLIGSLGRNMIVANTFGSFAMLVVMALGGYIISRDRIPSWWIWGFWISPLMYAQNSASVNEFLGHSWNKKAGNQTTYPLGMAVLKERSLYPESYWYWIGLGAMVGYTILFNTLFTIFLAYLNPVGRQQAVVSKDELQERENRRKGESVVIELREYLQHSASSGKHFKQRGMVLPFQPLSLAFSNINYYVDVPLELKQQGILEDRLQLLVNVTGAFRPGVLTALVGVSGAGKTTLMDVLAGRKTGGIIEGGTFISGYPKRQDTFARISGYCEQTDVHSPCLTVWESLLFSAWLRLSSDVDLETQKAFVEEIMELVELTPLSGALVGLPGIDGLSTEQRKRLTIAVELVANPSIVFMDEPTSGLDARAAAIVMRTVRNIVNTGRTIVCTIHQPSIDIFESFDELLFMKRGGELIYAGPLGPKSIELISYFEAIEGVPKIRPGYNPATWMLEVTSSAEENRLGVDFAEIYRRSNLYQCNQELVESLSRPSSNSKELHFPSKYCRSSFEQFLTCLWKQNLSYWRNPQYTAVRFFYTVIISLMLGTICWRFGAKRETQKDLFNAMGSMYSAVLFIGITNATAVQPVVSVERFVSYRERAAGMYSALSFAFAQVMIEFPYVFGQAMIYSSIFYSMSSFVWTVDRFIWYLFFMYFTMLYFTFYGMMTTAVTPNHNVAAIIAAPFYMLWNLFSGFMIPHKRIPIWWRWYYWANPVAWSLYGLLTSQYGDDNKLVKLSDGNLMTIRQVLKDVFGYRHDFLYVAATMVAGFCIFFAIIFAFAIKSFNFQRR
ncbi:ABC transporter G family member 32 isoform X2 [Gastrolobium bilobum]|uniref:ABC transporter G family member 32 isoform X2 n=1 Tax=Gastrolobium bilobum TaxID=150636 RepID=UPI002AB0FEAA|nr:ABC transporter G family member 32 isoform X2 [Gastrolobium bilobum]